jgi:hypothetical protein
MSLHLVPFLIPIILDEPPLGVMVIVESSRNDSLVRRFQGETVLVLGDGNPRHLVGPCGNRPSEKYENEGCLK